MYMDATLTFTLIKTYLLDTPKVKRGVCFLMGLSCKLYVGH